MEIRFYESPGGASPVRDYLDSLNDTEAARVLASLEDIQEHGVVAARVAARQIEGKLWELKISRHRIFYVLIQGPTMVLLHAYKKRRRRLLCASSISRGSECGRS